MKDVIINGVRWSVALHVTQLMRKVYGFRRIGKILYCTPLNGMKFAKKLYPSR